ncbi:MAG: UUP1 family membrane protein, partial [Verrucomicrobia bacterium]|nr:UUP1 family membrane protein [Verrucomicrobiota bacterium]
AMDYNHLMNNFGKREALLALALTVLVIFLVGYKHFVMGYTMTSVTSEPGYQVALKVDVKGNGREVSIRWPLPMQTARQSIRREENESGPFRFQLDGDRRARWISPNFTGEKTLYYRFFAQTQAESFKLKSGPIETPEDYSKLADYLEPTEQIQSEDPEIESLAWRLIPPEISWSEGLRQVYEFVLDEIEFKAVRGPTDAVTALQVSSASCNGKNRLFIALLRARGIPARLCKGLILENTSKRTSHAWTEIFVVDKWIPFCPTNGYFAEIPENYLELSKEDSPLFRHSKYIGFDWSWIVETQVGQMKDAVMVNAHNPLNFLFYWVSLEDFNISLNLIMVILMIPVAATAVSFSRNIVGLVTFGTFMPALIAVSFLETGFFIGSVFFILVMFLSTLVNFALLKLRLLHIPRLVIMLTVVVGTIMLVSVTLVRTGLAEGAAISLFPIAILSLTSERLTQTISEDGWFEAFKRISTTFVVAAICYALIGQKFMQLLIIAYPELLLINIAINLLIGSWHGLRLTEHLRFKTILQP